MLQMKASVEFPGILFVRDNHRLRRAIVRIGHVAPRFFGRAAMAHGCLRQFL
jgi:hypothetical protein